MAKAKVKLEVSCVSYTDIDADTIMVKVLEKRTYPGIFRDTVTEKTETYTGLVRDHLWLDGRGKLADLAMRFELYQIALAQLAEQRLDRFIRL